MTGERARVRPDPAEAAVPASPRGRDLVKEKALLLGHAAMSEGKSPFSVEDFARGVEAYEQYRRLNDRRAW